MIISGHTPTNVILHGPHPNASGGVLAFCDTLETALKNHGGVEPKRWFIGAATGDGTTADGAVAGVKALLSSLPKLLALAKRGRVLHVNTSFTQKALVRDAIFYHLARLKGSRVIVQFHGGLPEHTTDRASRWAIRTLCAADGLVVINPGQGQQLVQLHPSSTGRIEEIANSVDLPDLNLSERIPQRLNAPRLLFLSRLDARKGLLETIRALRLLSDAETLVMLDVAGNGPALGDAKALVAELGLQDQVVFHGSVAGESKAQLFRNATAFMFPSYYPEGQPIAVLEAFAWGLPVVAANLEPVASLVPDGRSGLHVPPRDPQAVAAAVTRLLADQNTYRTLAQANRARAETEFNSRLAAERFSRLYQRALAGRAGR